MKKSRKLIAWIIGGIWLTVVFLLLIILKPNIGYIPVILAIVGGFIFLTTAYIGGTVYKDYIKSKHFRPELFNVENES